MSQQMPERLCGDNPTLQILRRVWQRLNIENEHWMHCIVGREGSGKSHTAIKLANLIDPDFSAAKAYFRPAELLKRLRDDEYQAGDIFIMDEAGVGMGKRTWQDSGQIKLNQALQLIRNHNVGLIFTLPRLSELDSQTQGRLHSYLEIRSKKQDHLIASWRELDPDRAGISGEIYRHAPEVDGQKIEAMRLCPPDDKQLVDRYERQKEKFQSEFYDTAIDELSDDDKDSPMNGDPSPSAAEIAQKIRENGGAQQYIREINNGTQVILDKNMIASRHGCGESRAKQVKARLMDDMDNDDIL